LRAIQTFIHQSSFIQNSNDISSREVLLGITGKDFTLIAASKAAMRGATILKATDDKTRSLNQHTLMAFSGEAGDTGTRSRSTMDSHTYLTHTRSAIRRIHPSQCPTLLDAQPNRPLTVGNRTLCSRRAGIEPEIEEAV
jgi:20S proteasome alpha/beta subunit